MERLFFHVVRHGARWSVWVARNDSAQFFDRLGDAMDSAIRSAKSQWELRGRPSGVRLELPNGLCVEERTFGSNVRAQ